MVMFGLVWFGLVYLFIHSVTYVTLDTSVTDYSLQHNLQYMDIHIIQYMCIYINIPKI